MDRPVELLVTENLQGIDFSTDINISLPSTASGLFVKDGFSLGLKTKKEVAE